jgi:uncharacterized SAM-binding protein YcdF (DUF218 family)
MAAYLVIFGAAVRADGSPSRSLAKRVDDAVTAGRRVLRRTFVATGGRGRTGPPEAHVIRELLMKHGIADADILIEDQATDTLQSVLRCHALLKQRPDVDYVIPCSSSYHNVRCALLFGLLGYRVKLERVASDRAHLGWAKWLRYVSKEALALPYDAGLLMMRRKR